MKTQTRHAAVAWALAVGLTLSLAACGSETAATTAQITLRSNPSAEVWIGGVPKGTTPIEVTLATGAHDITFKAAGFADSAETIAVVGGKDLTVDAELSAGTDGDATLTEIARVLDIKREPFGEIEVHRGRRDNAAVMLYWPQKDIRLQGLTSFRIDVTEDYAGDGFIEFHKGGKSGKLLHREAFTPAEFATVKAIPESVREKLKASSSVTWGVFYESKRKKDVTAKFTVTKKTKVDRQLAKLEKKKFFRRQPALVKGLMRAEVLRNNRLYSEALVDTLSVLKASPESIQPYRGIVQTARRLGLEKTPLYAVAARHVSGKGQDHGLGRPIQPLDPKGAQGTPLPPEFAAPQTPEADRPTEDDEEPGVTVQPTDHAPAHPTDEQPGVPAPTDPAIDALQRELQVREELASAAEAAESRMTSAAQVLESAEQTLRSEEQTLRDAVAAREALPDGHADIPDADSAVDRANNAIAAAEAARREAEGERLEAQEAAREVLGQVGSAREARRELEELRQRLADAQSAAGRVPGTTPEPRIDGPTTDPLAGSGTRVAHPDAVKAAANRIREQHARFTEARDRHDAAALAAEEAQQALDAAEALPATDPERDAKVGKATEERDRALEAMQETRGAVAGAEEALRKAEHGPGAPTGDGEPAIDPNAEEAERIRAMGERIRLQQVHVDAMSQLYGEARGAHDEAVLTAERAAEALAAALALPASDPDKAAKVAAATAARDNADQEVAATQDTMAQREQTLQDEAQELQALKSDVDK